MTCSTSLSNETKNLEYNYNEFYCALFRSKCTRVSQCVRTEFPGPMGDQIWEDRAYYCDIDGLNALSTFQGQSCSAEDVKRGTTKWVSFTIYKEQLDLWKKKLVDIQSGSCSSDADRCVCSSDGCNKPSDLELSDSPENNCSYALKDYPVPLLETSAPAPPPVINNYITVIVIIIQFKAPYTMSELTPDIQNKIAWAVS
jgi:hypothetical protein